MNYARNIPLERLDHKMVNFSDDVMNIISKVYLLIAVLTITFILLVLN